MLNNACMSSNVTLQVKGVVESFATELALVLLVGTVIASMAIEHPEVFESFATDFAAKRFFAVGPNAGFFLDFGEDPGELRRHVDLEGAWGVCGKVLERKCKRVEHGEEL